MLLGDRVGTLQRQGRQCRGRWHHVVVTEIVGVLLFLFDQAW